MEAFSHVQSYLIDPHDDGVDADGNTTIHQLMRFEPDWKSKLGLLLLGKKRLMSLLDTIELMSHPDFNKK
jgi:hypothetical protein